MALQTQTARMSSLLLTNNRLARLWAVANVSSIILLLTGCPQQSKTTLHNTEASSNFNWNKPAYIPEPRQPANNIASEAKFQLGRHLFYDQRLSANDGISCANCHQQDKAFTDGKKLPTGTTGDVIPRNSQALVNTAYNQSYTWANPVLLKLEDQILIPLFADSPIEHGLSDANMPQILATLKTDLTYQTLFNNAYPEKDIDDLDALEIVHSLAVFVRGLNSFNSPYDRYSQGDSSAISDAAKRGEALFNGERFECFHCHGGYNFTDSSTDITQLPAALPFHNTGLYNVDGIGGYPSDNTGIYELTLKPRDMGKFRAQTLRNIAVTAPYMHDGSIETLEEVIRTYAAGGRNITSGANQGDGRASPLKDILIPGFQASDQEINDVIAFLNTLTDTSFLENPRFSNPFTPPETP